LKRKIVDSFSSGSNSAYARVMKTRYQVLAIVWGGLLATTASAQHPKLSPDLVELLTSSPALSPTILIQYQQRPTALDILNLQLLGGVVQQTFTLVPALKVTLPVAAISAAANLANVLYASPDRTVLSLLDSTSPTVNAPSAWQSGWDGSGIGVAVIDSGIAAHADLLGAANTSRVVYHQSFIDSTTTDLYGHGTHVAGIIAGNGNASSGAGYTRTFKGIAPNATLVDLRVLDGNGVGTDSGVIMAVQAAVSLKAQYNIRVINLSLGRPVYESYHLDPVCRALEAAWSAGMTVVVAAGNVGRNGYATITSPGNTPEVITVGAMKTEGTPWRSDDLIASYSSRGPSVIDLVVKPDLVAPGNLTVSLLAPNSTLSQEYPQNVIPPLSYSNHGGTAEYFRLSGTSMATPVVSGAAAILLQANASLTPDTIKARLMKTASKNFPVYSTATDPTTGASYMDTYDIFTVGAGYLDIKAALANSDRANGGAISPSALFFGVNSDAYLVVDSCW
jgi:serine protease AprX